MAALGTEGETEDERGGWVGEGYETKLTCQYLPLSCLFGLIYPRHRFKPRASLPVSSSRADFQYLSAERLCVTVRFSP